jgi:DNA modification methylase
LNNGETSNIQHSTLNVEGGENLNGAVAEVAGSTAGRMPAARGPTLTVLCGDAVERLKSMGGESVQCCVTSPPYWGLRDYGVSGQIGLEKSPEEFVQKMVEVFREVRRVLRKDGTCWVNLGDSYNTRPATNGVSFRRDRAQCVAARGLAEELKPKDLCGIPWRVALALQADGWYLRCDIIWHKPNPMPESVTDRPTKSHEYIFLLTKSERYFYDAEAVLEECSLNTHARLAQDVQNQIGSTRANGGGKTNGNMKAVSRKVAGSGDGIKNNESFDAAMAIMPLRRNKRSVWSVPTFSYKEAHFATFPPDLITPCILAGTSAAGACRECGAPVERVLEIPKAPRIDRAAPKSKLEDNDSMAAACRKSGDYMNGPELKAWREEHPVRTVAWKMTCDCVDAVPGKFAPCVVLDPFGGSGTTGEVALLLGRSAVLIELNPDYVKLIEQRCRITPGLPLA